MARYLYGGTAADVTTTQAGQLVTGATLTVWDSQTGGTQITDLQDATGAAATVVTSDAYGRVLFYGPDNDTRSFWLESNVGGRVLVRPAASIMPADGSISNVHVNAAAAIARSKIAGLPTSSTDNTLPRFDGTGGALQNSGVTVDDSNHVNIPGIVYIVKDGMSLWLKASDSNSSYIGMRMTRGELRRWDISKSDYPAETGSGNTGSNLEIARYADDQSFLGRITYWRNTGKLTLDGVGSTAGLELGSSGPRIMAGTGSPESVVTAPQGSLWLRTDGGATTTLYVKTSGTGNTGWTAK